MSQLVIVGTVAFDAIETPFGKTDKILGGAATYIGLSASQFNLDSAIVSVVGNDFPQDYLELLSNRNIDISGLEIVKDGKTFFWSGRYHYDMNSRDTLVTELNVLADFNPIVPEAYKNAEVVMLGNLHPLVQLGVLDQMTTKPKLAILDTMDFWMDNALEDLHKVIARIDVLTINDEEARQLTGEYSLVNAAQKIFKLGPQFVVIKKGEHGALLFHKDEIFSAPALPLKSVFDPTGAGDTFAGGFAGFLANSGNYTFENMKTAIIYGSALASFCVEEFGTASLEKVTSEQLNSRLQQFKELTTFNIDLS
ncbi:PfkB family carbohydrate kinase [Formosa agariphila KMM 3901]|uniref:PfkB family carbohydrate kinase n=1 Tax=Formosa agariphila (strain DSM 15362 / KCTC 12365 / LMG 23005 / KMM 3901 / M-2Alg 35-1) TaxID=1347342 RepID=T2KSB3_FORAG|nr:PfkB family carbohydrate kinase [Formosa agariphila]CDF81119.1 PfkB family carbohydrate kinase [Formosa agariphila KMM 3901]